MTGSSLISTTSRKFVTGYQGGVGDTQSGIELNSAPSINSTFIDFHTTVGWPKDFDFRMQAGGGDTGLDGEAVMNVQGAGFNLFMPLRTSPKVGPLGLPFFVDYGNVAVSAGTNAITTITFNIVFTAAPTVQITWVDDGAGVQSHSLTEFITSTTTTECEVRCLGTPGAGFSYNWLAIGGV
jgi:hypothetical protein